MSVSEEQNASNVVLRRGHPAPQAPLQRGGERHAPKTQGTSPHTPSKQLQTSAGSRPRHLAFTRPDIQAPCPGPAPRGAPPLTNPQSVDLRVKLLEERFVEARGNRPGPPAKLHVEHRRGKSPPQIPPALPLEILLPRPNVNHMHRIQDPGRKLELLFKAQEHPSALSSLPARPGAGPTWSARRIGEKFSTTTTRHGEIWIWALWLSVVRLGGARLGSWRCTPGVPRPPPPPPPSPLIRFPND